jgi:hypothetical protein
MKQFTGIAQTIHHGKYPLVAFWTDGVMVSSDNGNCPFMAGKNSYCAMKIAVDKEYRVTMKHIDAITFEKDIITDKGVTFQAKANMSKIDGEDNIGVWTDGIGLYADNDQGCFFRLTQGEHYEVKVEAISDAQLIIRYEPNDKHAITIPDGQVVDWVNNLIEQFQAGEISKMQPLIGSELILTALRVAIKEGQLAPEQLHLSTQNTRIHIDEDGNYHKDTDMRLINDVYSELLLKLF